MWKVVFLLKILKNKKSRVQEFYKETLRNIKISESQGLLRKVWGGKFSPSMQILKGRGMGEPYLKIDIIISLETVGAGKHLLQNYFLH